MKPKLKKIRKGPIATIAKKASPARRTGSTMNTLFYGENIAEHRPESPGFSIFSVAPAGLASVTPERDSRLLASILNRSHTIHFSSSRRMLLPLTRRS